MTDALPPAVQRDVNRLGLTATDYSPGFVTLVCPHCAGRRTVGLTALRQWVRDGVTDCRRTGRRSFCERPKQPTEIEG